MLAVPAAVGHLLTEEAFDDAADVLTEVRPDRDGPAVDTWLDLAIKEAQLLVVLPSRIAGAGDRATNHIARWVDAHRLQEPEREESGGRVGQERAASPSAV